MFERNDAMDKAESRSQEVLGPLGGAAGMF